MFCCFLLLFLVVVVVCSRLWLCHTRLVYYGYKLPAYNVEAALNVAFSVLWFASHGTCKRRQPRILRATRHHVKRGLETSRKPARAGISSSRYCRRRPRILFPRRIAAVKQQHAAAAPNSMRVGLQAGCGIPRRHITASCVRLRTT